MTQHGHSGAAGIGLEPPAGRGWRPSAAPPPIGWWRVTIGVFTLAAVAGVLLIRSASEHVTGNATPRYMAVDRLRFTISDMNGAQNLYVLDGGRSRPDYLAAERAYVAALAAAERLVDARRRPRAAGPRAP